MALFISVLTCYNETGKIDPAKLNALIFDQFQSGYYVAGEKVGQAWHAGAAMMKAAKKG